MSSHAVPYFALPVQPGRLPVSQRAAAALREQYGKKRKREDREEDGAEEEVDTSGDESDTSLGLSTPGASAQEDLPAATAAVGSRAQSQTASLRSGRIDPRDAEQDRVAGQSVHEPRPDNSFPHRRQRDPSILKGAALQQAIAAELAHLNPPVYVADWATSGGGSRFANVLHRRHLSVITTILHRCLLEGDYVRASRAWGLILRSDVGGRAPDVRGQGRWGIGAEVLMRRDKQLRRMQMERARRAGEQERRRQEQSSSPDDPDVGHAEQDDVLPVPFGTLSQQGLSKARDYYERLILQYPFNRRQPKAVNALHFYPAMFGLWIYAVQEQQRVFDSSSTRVSKQLSSRSSSPSPGRGGSPDDMDEDHPQSRRKAQRRLHTVAATLSEATTIATRLDDLLSSPPSSDSLVLWHLRGMVGLWIASLCDTRSPEHAKPEVTSEDDEDREDEDESTDQSDWPRQRDEEYGKAREAFGKVRKGGQVVWEGVPEEFRLDRGGGGGGAGGTGRNHDDEEQG